MFFLDVILIGLALSMDACALTISNCTTYQKSLTRKKEWLMPILFALFQGIMPLIGYFLGSLFAEYVSSFTKYLTAVIFFILSFKIVIDILKEKKTDPVCTNKKDCSSANLTFAVLLIQALATSIDALAVGITFIGAGLYVLLAVLIISAVTFALVSLSLLFGKKLGEAFGGYAEWIGAGILFVLAAKALIEALLQTFA